MTPLEAITTPDRILLIDESWGIYVPQRFAEMFPDHVANEEDLAILQAGPDHDDYWETWDATLRDTTLHSNGVTYNLEQDGDLWAVASN